MTETIEPVPDRIDQHQLAQQLIDTAREQGAELVGPGGMLAELTRTVVETPLEAEMSEHLGYNAHDPAGRDGANSPNGTRTKTVLTQIGPVEIVFVDAIHVEVRDGQVTNRPYYVVIVVTQTLRMTSGSLETRAAGRRE